MRIFILPLLFIVLSASAPGAAGRTVELGKQFTIRAGKQVVVKGEKLSITFKSVSDDSRCATGATCVWAGTAAVEIGVSMKSLPTVATLNIWLGPKGIVYKGFKIRLEALSPYPKVNQPIARKHYEASLIVTKNE